MADARSDGARWLRYAREDLATAEAILVGPTPIARNACYHAQQTAEKALKAVLVYLQIQYPFSHDLDEIRDCIPIGWQVKADHPNLHALTARAFTSRYPGRLPEATLADARAACDQARAVLDSVVRDLQAHGFAP